MGVGRGRTEVIGDLGHIVGGKKGLGNMKWVWGQSGSRYGLMGSQVKGCGMEDAPGWGSSRIGKYMGNVGAHKGTRVRDNEGVFGCGEWVARWCHVTKAAVCNPLWSSVCQRTG